MGAVNGYRIKQARELRPWTQVELAERVGVQQSTIARIESGLLQPSDELLDRLSVQTGFPKRFFALEGGPRLPEGSLVFYRRRASLKAPDRTRIHHLAEVTLLLLDHVSRRYKQRPNNLPIVEHEDYQTAAGLTRSALGLPSSGPVKHLVRTLEANGVLCLPIPCDTDEFDAFSARNDRRAIIAINQSMPTDRLRHTVAHEIGHLVRNHVVMGSLSEMEDEAHSFAAEFLMPEEDMRRLITAPVTLSSLAKLKPAWGVSIKNLVYRAQSLGIIKDHQARYLFMKHQKEWGKSEPGSHLIHPEKPRLLRQMIEEAHDGDVRRLATETGIPSSLVARIVMLHAGKPGERDGGRETGGQVVQMRHEHELLEG